MERLPAILTIAGSDSGGGAGIQADLKTIAMLGGYGASVVTALTAQNTRTVTAIHAPDPGFVAEQLRAVLDDIPIRAAKTGMLFSAGIIEAVADGLKGKTFPLVVDPVCVAQSGARLLKDDALEALVTRMVPLADLLTPNRREAEVIAGMTVDTEADIFRAMERMLTLGAGAVLVKGGHFEGRVMVDWLGLPDCAPLPIRRERVENENNHGTGCTLAAAIATHLGLGLPLADAVEAARDYLQLCLRAAFPLGGGAGPVNHSAPFLKERARGRVLGELRAAGRRLRCMDGVARLVPEVRMNLALALPWASKVEDVAAFPGRITATLEGEVIPVGCPVFGASSHMARVILEASRRVPGVRAAANIRHGDDVLRAVKRAGLRIARFDRAAEPPDTKEREGSTLEWGTRAALKGLEDPAAVDVICDRGDFGKEPMIRILGRDADDILDKIERVLAELGREE